MNNPLPIPAPLGVRRPSLELGEYPLAHRGGGHLKTYLHRVVGYPQNTSRCPLGNIFAQPLPKWNIFCYCSFILCIGFSGPNTLPKWNIFCYCSLIVCIGLSGPQHPPKVRSAVCSRLLLPCPIAPYTPQVVGTPTHTWPLGASLKNLNLKNKLNTICNGTL